MNRKEQNLINISNPAFRKFADTIGINTSLESMSVKSTGVKLAILLAIVVFSAGLNWYFFSNSYYVLAGSLTFCGAILGLILGIVTIFKPNLASKTSVIYAGCQGLLLGMISAHAEKFVPGVVPIAICLTLCTTIAMLFAYLTGLLKATENFKLLVICGSFSIAATYLVAFVFSLFGTRFPLIHDTNIYGIIFSLIVVAIASLNLILDFDLIERGVEARLPKYMEWYAAFSVLLTLIWIYIEVLRLASKFLRRR